MSTSLTCASRKILAIDEFIQGLRQTENNCYLIDQHFDRDDFLALREAFEFHIPKELKIITGSRNDARSIAETISELRETLSPLSQKQVSCGVGYTRGNKEIKLHDRFAILDDILWHFGSTIGVYYGHLTAVSEWNGARSRNAVTAFKEVWERLSINRQAWVI